MNIIDELDKSFCFMFDQEPQKEYYLIKKVSAGFVVSNNLLNNGKASLPLFNDHNRLVGYIADKGMKLDVDYCIVKLTLAEIRGYVKGHDTLDSIMVFNHNTNKTEFVYLK